jgi:hypothetical protein
MPVLQRQVNGDAHPEAKIDEMDINTLKDTEN